MTTLLIDADILIYRYACTAETKIDWEGDGEVSRSAGDLEEVYEAVKGHAESLRTTARASSAILCVSGAGNWRPALWPLYKAHRKPSAKPLLIDALRTRCAEDGGYQREGLEADDILGILATHKSLIPGKKVIWSVDKDLMQIPGLHLVDGKVVDVSTTSGDHWHLMQTLMGDQTDGYPGCPGIGPKKGAAILDAPDREGVDWPNWRAAAWDRIVTAFESRGLTEADALIQARVARILRADEYDFDTKQPILWSPSA